jgi:putative peptidoglycan lipid II flippase
MAEGQGSRAVRLTGWLVGGAIVGKILGFVREIALARLLGTSFVADSFRGAITAVLLPLAPLQNDVMPSVLIPLHRQWAEEGRAAGLFNSLMAVLGCMAVVLAVTVWCLADVWINFLVPGFSPEAHLLTVRCVHVMSLAMPASVLCGGLMCIEISIGRSRVASLRSSVQNVAVIIGILIMAATGQPLAVAWAFVFSFNSVVVYGGYKLWREGEIVFSLISFSHAMAAFRMFLQRFRPLAALPFFEQGSLLVERLMASDVGVGSLASLEYARTLSDTLSWFIAQPLGFVLLTGGEASARRIDSVSRAVLGLAIPLSLYFAIFAPDMAHVVFERGAFGAHAVAMTAGGLRGIAAGLWAATLGWILLRMLNAAGRNSAVGWIVSASYAGNILVNLVVVRYAGVFGLGLGESARGLILLAGSAVLLGCARGLLRVLAEMLGFAVCLALLCFAVRSAIDVSILRVIAGGAVTGVTILAWYASRVPESREAVTDGISRLAAARLARRGETR